MNKKTIIGVVGVLIATTLLAYGANSMMLFGANKTEKRITVSRSYIDYWEYNNNKGVYKVEGSTIAGGDAVIGERFAHGIQNPYYRGLQPGEKVVGVEVRVASRNNVTKDEFIESQYEEIVGGATWTDYNMEQRFTGQGTQISNVNVKSISDATSTHPEVGVIIGAVLIDPADAYPLTSTGPHGTSRGFRVYTTYVLEWEIELAAEPEVTVQHFNQDTGTKIIKDDKYEVPVNTAVSENARELTGVEYKYSEVSEDGGNSWSLWSENETRNIIIGNDTIIRFYYGAKGVGKEFEVVVQHYNKINNQELTSDTKHTVKYGDTFSTSVKTFTGFKLDNSVITTNDGESWRLPSKSSTRNIIIGGKTIIRFYYVKEDEDGGEEPPDLGTETTAKLWFYSKDKKILETSDRGRDILIGLPKSVIDYDEEYELNVILDAYGSKSTNGIGSYGYEFLEPYVDEIVKTGETDDELFVTIKLRPSDTFQEAAVLITDKVDKTSDDWVYDRIDIRVEALMQPPSVNLKIDKNEFWYSETALLSPEINEIDGETYPIDKREWVITDDKGKVKTKGDGTVPRNIKLEWDKGVYTATQTINYTNRDNEKKSDSASVTFEVKDPLPLATLKVEMVNRFNNERIPLAYNNRGKVYKEIEVDISDSTKTQPTLEVLFPTDLTNERTEIVVLPLTNSGVYDSTRNVSILTKNSSDKTMHEGKVSFRGKGKVTIRIDEPGDYKVMAKVYNGIMDSEWVESTFTIRPDPPPVIHGLSFTGASYNSGLGKYIDSRDEIDNKTTFELLANYGIAEGDDDTIDVNKTLLQIYYDKNNNGNFKDDGVYSTMYMNKVSNSLGGLLNAVKNSNLTSFKINTINNPNILGDFKFNLNIEKKPTISYYEGGDMPDAPRYKVNREVGLMIDNLRPTISVTTGKESMMEIHIFQVDVDRNYVDVNALKNKYKDKVDIYTYDRNANRTKR